MDTYGITEAEYGAILEAQGNACAICRSARPYRLDVDHDHGLERAGLPARLTIRGLLCKRCNRRLLPAGQDSVIVLEAAIDYLTFPPALAVLGDDGVLGEGECQ